MAPAAEAAQDATVASLKQKAMLDDGNASSAVRCLAGSPKRLEPTTAAAARLLPGAAHVKLRALPCMLYYLELLCCTGILLLACQMPARPGSAAQSCLYPSPFAAHPSAHSAAATCQTCAQHRGCDWEW